MRYKYDFHFLLLFALCTSISDALRPPHEASQPHFSEEYLHTQLSSYELLQPVKLISQRSAFEDAAVVEHMHFKVFNRPYHLKLEPDRVHSTQPPQKIFNMHNGTLFPMNLTGDDLFSDFFVGQVENEPDSWVTGYKDGGLLYLTIQESSDVLNVEPLSMVTGNFSDDRLLAYYDSSFKGSQYRCAAGRLDSPSAASTLERPPLPSPPLSPSPLPPRRARRRRSSTPRRPAAAPTIVCRLQAVADHTFVGHVGSVRGALKAVIKLVDDVNQIFLAAEYPAKSSNETFRGFGFELSSLIAIATPTDVPPIEPTHFNSAAKPNRFVSASVLLEAFGDSGQNGLDFLPFCLGHLITFRRLSGQVLGLAYQGSPFEIRYGGICSAPSPSMFGRGRRIARNIALSTFSNKEGKAILTRQAVLVTAHELGHSMGSPHDPPAGECSPGPQEGGRFLMYERAVSGNRANHNRMSPCSRRIIGEVIGSRKNDCFTAPSGRVCGNSRREVGEDCDAGPVGDACCGPDCRLRVGATCSDANAPCCRGCRPATAGTVCRKALPLWPCRTDAVCDGRSDSCPSGTAAPHGAVCLLGFGACSDGICRSLCQLEGLRDSLCSPSVQSCRLCCTDDGGAKQVIIPTCTEGSDGVTSGAMMLHLWRLASSSGGHSFAEAMKWNMVFVVVLLSLLIWVPLCCILEKNALVSQDDDNQVG